MKKTTDLSSIVKIADHKRAETTWICRAAIVDGKPQIIRMARIVLVYPADGAGTLRGAVTDWGVDGIGSEPVHYVGSVGGYGYDKRTALLEGATVGGVELGDHCNGRGKPTLQSACDARGWEIIGSL